MVVRPRVSRHAEDAAMERFKQNQFGHSEIPSEDLALADIPGPEARWTEILDFALTFDGYEYWGSLERCAEVANARAHGTLDCLRTCLFFEQRSWRHADERPPTKKRLAYWHSLLKKMRAMVSKQNGPER